MGLAAYDIVGGAGEWHVRHDGESKNTYETKEAAFEAAVVAASLALRQGHGVTLTVPEARAQPARQMQDRPRGPGTGPSAQIRPALESLVCHRDFDLNIETLLIEIIARDCGQPNRIRQFGHYNSVAHINGTGWRFHVIAKDEAELGRINYAAKTTTERLKRRYCLKW